MREARPVQKAFPKVLGIVLGVIAYGVALVIAVTGGGSSSERLWVVVIAVPVLLVVFAVSDRRRRSRRNRHLESTGRMTEDDRTR
jgi:peptidoglycan/LPS O-acetylase OafA/YrhL